MTITDALLLERVRAAAKAAGADAAIRAPHQRHFIATATRRAGPTASVRVSVSWTWTDPVVASAEIIEDPESFPARELRRAAQAGADEAAAELRRKRRDRARRAARVSR